MAYSGRISYEGNEDDAKALLYAAINQAEKHAAWMENIGMQSASRSYDLGNDCYCIVTKLAHREALHIVTPTNYPLTEVEHYLYQTPSTDSVGVVDIVSGIVRSPILEDVEWAYQGKDANGRPKTFKTTVKAIKAFTGTVRTNARYSDVQARAKLGVPEQPAFTPLRSGAALDKEWSQYEIVRSSRYSGKMRKLVQLMLGLGFVRKETAEQKWVRTNKKSFIDKKQTDPDTDTTSEVESGYGLYTALKKPDEVKPYPVMYDYRAAKTHGIIKTDDPKLWYVAQISNKGIYAMKLHFDPVSMTKEGRERYLQVSPELEDFFDEFGGFPLPLSFPMTSKYEEFIKAGEMIRLLPEDEVRPFFTCIPYSSEHGWCFNESGTEAHNTAWKYSDDGYYQKGVHYAATFRAAKKAKEFVDSPAGLALAAKPKVKQAGYHMVNKARRLSKSQADSILFTWGINEDRGWEAFESATAEPSVTASVTFTKISEGNLFARGRHSPQNCSFSGQPMIKFPEPLFGGLVSFQFEPGTRAYKNEYACDTTMFVMFDGDDLKRVCYYRPTKPPVPPPPPVAPPEGCEAILGTTKTESGTGDPFHVGSFYSTDVDWRDVKYPSHTTSVSTSTIAGTYASAGPITPFARCVAVAAYTLIKKVTDTESRVGQFMRDAVAIPLNDRCCYYMAKLEGADKDVVKVHFVDYFSVFGGHTHYYDIYNFALHWTIGCPQGSVYGKCIAKKVGEVVEDSCIELVPGDLTYSVCPERVYAGTEIVTVGPYVSGQRTNFPLPRSTITTDKGREIGCEVVMVMAGHGKIQLKKETKTGEVDMYDLDLSTWWFRASPDCNGAVAQLRVSRSCLGGDVANYEDDFDGEVKHIGGPGSMKSSQYVSYVGVIEP